VAQLCKDFEGDYVEVNKQLDKMGYNIGLRLIEEFLAKSNIQQRCSNFKDTAEVISKVSLSQTQYQGFFSLSFSPMSRADTYTRWASKCF